MPVILVTGASRGIGAETCRQLCARDCTVIAASRSGTAPFGNPVRLDVTDPGSVHEAVWRIRHEYGTLNGLVNNAGVLHDRDGSILDLSDDVLLDTLQTNLLGPMRVAQQVWPLLADHARIVNVSSQSGQLAGMDDWAPGYSVSKTALNALTVQLSLAGRERGIIVNSACPGWVRTDMGGMAAPRSVEEGAAGIVHLLLDAPPDINGCFIRDGAVLPW